ncbi:DUF1840 domain-containing protein [Variovorax sp. UC122_21]|uniref:DUF1840 domain-containing protein n=1 Tax=Variovorax TaxID=34072 RepID=UPI001932D5B5|nr:DUF1840 domain-containing protein [Variovorax paradoxus]
MLYRFQSRASSDFVMLETHARQLFDIVGKSPSAQGIITVEQIPGAISAIEAALAREKANTHNHDEFAVEDHNHDAEKQHVALHQRATPLLHMLKESLAENKDVTWTT